MLTKKIIALAKPIIPYLIKYPRVKSWAKKISLGLWQQETNLRTKRLSADIDVNKTYWINPDRIEYACILQEGYDKFADRGKIIGGSWDKQRTKFVELDTYRAFEGKFIYGNAWEKTDFYHRVLEEIAQGKVKWGCTTKAEFDQRLINLETLYYDIKENGYKTQQELAEQQSVSFTGEDEISVQISRSGEYLFDDGKHRLIIAKLLDLTEIPVKVTIRHDEWYQFRKEILNYAAASDGRIYQPITHPDLSDIPSVFGDERFNIIKKHMPIQSGSLLDIGAHWGYFCHRFEEDGFNCYPVESDARHIYFLEKLKQADNRNFTIITGSIFDYYEKTDFDVVLALNIFHHFLKSENLYHQLVALLERLQIKVMFFQAHLPDTEQMKGAYRNYTPDEFVNFIIKHTTLSEAVYLGQTQDDRPIYKLM